MPQETAIKREIPHIRLYENKEALDRLSDRFCDGFSWVDSIQGDDYWGQAHDAVMNLLTHNYAKGPMRLVNRCLYAERRTDWAEDDYRDEYAVRQAVKIIRKVILATPDSTPQGDTYWEEMIEELLKEVGITEDGTTDSEDDVEEAVLDELEGPSGPRFIRVRRTPVSRDSPEFVSTVPDAGRDGYGTAVGRIRSDPRPYNGEAYRVQNTDSLDI